MLTYFLRTIWPSDALSIGPLKLQETLMKKQICLALAALLLPFIASAEDFDGSKPMICEAQHGHDCLPTAQSCSPLKPQGGKDVDLKINVGSKTMKSPYRNDLLPIQHVTKNKESLVLQGTTLQLVWSATVHRTTGRLTAAIADREGAYVVFGQCRLATAAEVAAMKTSK
jgi:hypothetical protein